MELFHLLNQDDDAYLHSGNLEDLGEICLEFWKIRIKKATTTFTRADVSQHHVKVHETVKKGMAHRVKCILHRCELETHN